MRLQIVRDTLSDVYSIKILNQLSLNSSCNCSGMQQNEFSSFKFFLFRLKDG